MPAGMNRKKKRTGGLHINFHRGERKFISHNGEVLEVVFHGPSGTDQFSVSFVGSKNFLITRNNPLEQKGPTND